MTRPGPTIGRPGSTALRNERGVALLIVLIVVALLTITVTEFTYSVQIDLHRTRNAIHALQAQLLARSGVNLAEGFLMLDEEPNYDAYSEDWWLHLLEFCKDLQLDESMRLRCSVRDESGKLNINNTRGVIRRVQSPQVTGDAVLRDAMRCMFQRRGIEVDIVDKLADYWQQEPPPNPNGDPSVIPDFTSLEDFGATFGISGELLHQLRNVMTAQPSRLLQRININTAPPEVLAAVINAEEQDCPPSGPVEEIVKRQRDIDQPFRNAGDINTVIQGVDHVDLKRRLFDVRSRLYRLEASAQANIDPTDPTSGGIGQTLSVLVSRQQDARARPGSSRRSAPTGNRSPTGLYGHWTGRRKVARGSSEASPADENLPGSPDDQEEPNDAARPMG